MRLALLSETTREEDDKLKKFMDFDNHIENKKLYRMVRNTGEKAHPNLPEPRQIPIHSFEADNPEHASYIATQWLINNNWEIKKKAKIYPESMMTRQRLVEIYAVPTKNNPLFKEFRNLRRTEFKFNYQIWIKQIDEYEQLQRDYLANRYGWRS